MSGSTEGDGRVEPAVGADDAGSSGRSLTRRQALQAGAAAVAVAALDADSASAGGWSEPDPSRAPRWELSFDEDWRFYRGDLSGAHAPAFDDRAWRQLDVPHDWRIEDLPYATSDDAAATADPSGFAFNPQIAGSPGGTAPRVIGPFDADADPVPDLDVTYPGIGEIVFPGGRSQGYTVGDIGWYRKHFTAPRLSQRDDHRHGTGDDQRVEMRFDGVYGRADVWLNGVHLGFHPNGYTSFAYDLTPYLNRRGENVLAVRVDNTGKTSRWYSGSGVYRHTWLTVTRSVRIPLWGVRVTTPTVDRRRSVARVEAQVANTGASAAATSVRMTVLDPRGRACATSTTPVQTVAPGATKTYTAQLTVSNAALWSPEDPNLYQVRTEVLVGRRVVDELTATFGIRSLVFNGTDGFLLNGKSYKLVGGNLHHDHGPLGTVALDRAEERTIEVMKAAGFNIIRGSHNPRSPALLDACDRLGMLVHNEFTDMWDTPKLPDDYSKYFPEWWERDLTSMVLRDRNHPSVIIWSIGNEISADPNNYGPRLAALVHSLDTTRPLALGGQNVGTAGATAWSYVDIGDYHGPPTAADHAAHPDKAFFQSEDTSPQIYSDWKLAHDNAWYIGSLVWAGWDYIGESGSGATVAAHTDAEAQVIGLGAVIGRVPYPWFNDFQGDIDLIGQRKPQNYWRQVVHGLSPLELMVERPTPPGTQQYNVWYCYYEELPSWTWDVPAGKAMVVRAYTTGDSVTLLLNGTPIATTNVTDADQRRVSFSVPYTPGELTAVASRNGKQIARKTLVTTGQPAGIRLTSDVRSLSTDRGDLAHVLVEIIDSRGRAVPDAVVRVNFLTSGAGRLLGTGNGNPHNVDSFQRPRHYTWHGQVLAVLRPAKTPGRLNLTVTAQGLRPATLSLPVAAAHAAAHAEKTRRTPRATHALASFGPGPALLLGLTVGALRRRMHQTPPPPADALIGSGENPPREEERDV